MERTTMSSTDPNASHLPSGDDATQSPEPQITPAVDPSEETRETVAQRPAPVAQFSPPVMQPAPSHTSTAASSNGFGAKVVAIAAALALLFGAVAGGVAGGVAGYAVADRDDDTVVTAVPTGNE